MNLNERIIGNQLFAQRVDEVTATAIGSAAGGIGAGLVPFIATAAFGPALTNPGIGTANHHQQQQQQISGVIRPGNGPTLLKQNTEIIHLSPHHHLPLNHPLMLQKQQQQLKAAKSRSLSTGSYITKESSVHSSVEKITKSNSNSELTENAQKTIETIPKNKSLEDSRTMKLNQSHYSPMRKPILRKSKKIIRTDSEFLKGNIYEKESSLSSSQYTPTHEKRREFAEYCSSNPSSETHKSTDESSKNISTDEIDTVFSDTMELEQMEADYKMHLKNNLQREYKSDSDTLDEVGKKQPDYSTWKNQSYENTFDIFEEKEQEQEESGNSSKEVTKTDEDSKKETERSKSVEDSTARKASETDIKFKRTADRPTELELGTSSDGSKNPSVDGSFGHIFEKNLGRFKRMNKLLKCKRFSTSALYDKKSKPNFKETMFFEDKTSPAKPTTEPAERSPVKSCHSQSKASISSSKSSLFGTKKGNVFTLKGKKFLFSGSNNATSNGNAKTSPNKSKSNNEISYFRTKSTKGSKKSLKNNSTACLNLETTCTSPLSEAFYNTTGSVRLSAMELYEKFCSQDFSGLYKHEAIHHSDGQSGTDSEPYDPNRSLGAIRKYKRRNFKLLRQKSEPKFSFRSDTLYENEDSYDDTCYPDEEQKDEFEVEDYNQFLYDEQYYEEDIENLSIENIYYRGNLVREDGTVVEAYQYQEEDDEEGDEEEEDEEEEEGDDDEEEDDEEEEEEEEIHEEQGIAIPDRKLQLPLMDMATSMDSDCDEIYLMPQNESKKLIIHDFLFHHSNNEFDNVDDEYEVTEEELEAIDAGKDQDTLTIYKICSRESILSSKGDLDNIALSSSLDPYFLKSDCLTALERTTSLELLSNSSGTLNKSTLTDYAFDTVKNANLDSCSTSRLSLSLKSEIFEETLANGANSGSGEIKQIKNWNIEDFTLTPDGSFSDETMDELLKTHLAEEGDSKTTPTETRETVVNPLTSEYTIIDLDEEPYMMDPAISDFTNEITKEFDLLFSRAETESRAASYSGSPAYDEEEDGQQPMHLDQLDVQPAVVIELPTRYSMQKLEPINLDADEITINRHTEDQLKMQHDSAKEVAVVDNKCSKTVDKQKPSEPDRTTTAVAAATDATGGDRLRKARSQSLGNLKNKTKCFPL
ncbi:glutamic acid-rich protein-like [Ochlerotatus camptorhynchus]|uniref:glutamic acid-rich protein-like n=1 Tax=Ochlerotatus camptorhynchus TaxID=644619 RepID=UPI0031E21401